MIDMTSGVITPEQMPSLVPFMSRDSFLGIYPETAIEYAHTPEKGDCHYFLAPCMLYGTPCRLALCFDREQGLAEVRFSVSDRPADGPAEQDGVERPVSKSWRPQEESALKALNDQFLISHCGFTKKDRGKGGDLMRKTPFGTMRSFFDAKGCSSDIVLTYQKPDDSRQPEKRV